MVSYMEISVLHRTELVKMVKVIKMVVLFDDSKERSSGRY